MEPSVRRSLVLPLYLPALVMLLGKGLLLPVFPVYVATLTDSYKMVGLMLAAAGLGMLAGDVPAGLLLTRIGHRRTMLIGAGGMALTLAGLYWVTSIAGITALRFAGGLASALWGMGRHAYVAEATSTENRGRALSTFGGLFRIARFISPALGGLVAGTFGTHVSFLCAAGMVVAAAAIVAVFTHDPKPAAGRVPEEAPKSMRSVLRESWRDLAGGGTGQLLAQMTRSGRMAFVPLYASKILGLGVGTVGMIMSIGALFEVLMFVPAGIVMDRFGRKKAVVPSFFVQGVGMAIVPFTSGFGSLLGACCLMGLGNGMSAGAMMTLGADFAPKESRGQFLGVWRTIGDTGSTGSPLVIGLVADNVTLPAASFFVAGFGVLAAGVFALFVPETLFKK
jgi:MFS family permease